MADLIGVDVGKLRRMSHVELQTLAKTLNIKANMKSVKLRDAIMDRMQESFNDVGSPVTEFNISPENKKFNSPSGALTEEPVGPSCEIGETSQINTNIERRRTFEVIETPPVDPNAQEPSISAESEYFTAPTPKATTDDEEAAYLSARTERRSNSSNRTPRVKIPKVTRDQSVGRTPPVRRIYNLRSNRSAVDEKSIKSLIPRLIKNAEGGLKNIQRERTPNFSKIHQKAFEKLESLDVYISKKQQLRDNYKSFASKGNRTIPPTQRPKVPSGECVFKPSVLTTTNINFDFSKMRPPKTPKPKSKPMTQAESTSANETFIVPVKKSFNLAESLARKLRYQPHTGPLRPLEENSQSSSFPQTNIKVSGHNTDTMRQKQRTENKEFLKGVRRNRRLDLQLKMRGVIP